MMQYSRNAAGHLLQSTSSDKSHAGLNPVKEESTQTSGDVKYMMYSMMYGLFMYLKAINT